MKTDTSMNKVALESLQPTDTHSEDDTAVEKNATDGVRAEEISPSRTIGNIIPFLSDVSSSESDTELPPSLPCQQKAKKRGRGSEGKEAESEGGEVEKDSVSFKRETNGGSESEEVSEVKEEATVKISTTAHPAPGKNTITINTVVASQESRGEVHACMYLSMYWLQTVSGPSLMYM